MSTSPQEDRDWVRRYHEDYLTLDELASVLGITTREGASQRLERAGIRPRTPEETRSLRRRRNRTY